MDEEAQRWCPDEAWCHHNCPSATCYRVQTCSPLSGYGLDEWEPEVVERFGSPAIDSDGNLIEIDPAAIEEARVVMVDRTTSQDQAITPSTFETEDVIKLCSLMERRARTTLEANKLRKAIPAAPAELMMQASQAQRGAESECLLHFEQMISKRVAQIEKERGE